MPARSSERATFFSHVVRLRTRDPVFRSLPIGLKTFESTSNRFIPDQALRHTLGRAHVSRQGQRPHARGLAIEARRLMPDVLEAFTRANVQHGRDCFGTMRLPFQALSPLLVQGMDNMTDSLNSTAHQLRNRLRQHPTGTGEHDLGTTDTEGVRCAPIGLQLEPLIIGQRSNKERWFHSPSILRETPLHKNSCGDALG